MDHGSVDARAMVCLSLREQFRGYVDVYGGPRRGRSELDLIFLHERHASVLVSTDKVLHDYANKPHRSEPSYVLSVLMGKTCQDSSDHLS